MGGANVRKYCKASKTEQYAKQILLQVDDYKIGVDTIESSPSKFGTREVPCLDSSFTARMTGAQGW